MSFIIVEKTNGSQVVSRIFATRSEAEAYLEQCMNIKATWGDTGIIDRQLLDIQEK